MQTTQFTNSLLDTDSLYLVDGTIDPKYQKLRRRKYRSSTGSENISDESSEPEQRIKRKRRRNKLSVKRRRRAAASAMATRDFVSTQNTLPSPIDSELFCTDSVAVTSLSSHVMTASFHLPLTDILKSSTAVSSLCQQPEQSLLQMPTCTI